MKEIKLTKGQVALVDDKDFEELNNFKWQAWWNKDTESFYVHRSISTGGRKDRKVKTIKMHRFINNTPKNLLCDHADHNTLNNQKYNLRNCTHCNNNANARPGINKSSIYKGVVWDKQAVKWRSRVRFENRLYNLGFYESELQAALVYDFMAKKFFKEFACLNFPKNQLIIKYEYTDPKKLLNTGAFHGEKENKNGKQELM
jgi:hypothetical protein